MEKNDEGADDVEHICDDVLRFVLGSGRLRRLMRPPGPPLIRDLGKKLNLPPPPELIYSGTVDFDNQIAF